MSGAQQQRRRSSMVVGIIGEQCQVSSHRRRLNRLAWEADDGVSIILEFPEIYWKMKVLLKIFWNLIGPLGTFTMEQQDVNTKFTIFCSTTALSISLRAPFNIVNTLLAYCLWYN